MRVNIVGNEKEGFGVTISFDAEPLACHDRRGEFSAVFQNGDHSLEDAVSNWRSPSWSKDKESFRLSGPIVLKKLGVSLTAEVEI